MPQEKNKTKVAKGFSPITSLHVKLPLVSLLLQTLLLPAFTTFKLIL